MPSMLQSQDTVTTKPVVVDTAIKQGKHYKNVIRYNLSGPILFGFTNNVVVGYERLIGKRQSISVNFGKVSFPKIIEINTDSISVSKDIKNTGVNFSIDWRFYLMKENKYQTPHGVYIGPYYSYNDYERTNDFSLKRPSGMIDVAHTESDFDIHTFGLELGYQFVLWRRLTLDLLMIGPGISSYKLISRISDNLSSEDNEKVREALKQVLTQRFPGMNFVFEDKQLSADGILSKWDIGFRYLIHIGFLF